MKLRMLITAGLAFAAGVSVPTYQANAQFGYCVQPHAPTVFLSQPRRPFCATTRSCSEWEVSSYQRQVSNYFDDLRRYAGQVDSYYEDAQRYIECMATLD